MGQFFWPKLRRGAPRIPAVRLPNFSTGSRSKLLATSNANARKHSDHYSERSGFLRVHYVWTKQNAGQVSSFCTKKRDAQLARRLAAPELGCLIDWALSRRGDPTGSGLSWPRCLTWPWYSYARNPNFLSSFVAKKRQLWISRKTLISQMYPYKGCLTCNLPSYGYNRDMPKASRSYRALPAITADQLKKLGAGHSREHLGVT